MLIEPDIQEHQSKKRKLEIELMSYLSLGLVDRLELVRDIYSIQASSAPIEKYFSGSTFLMRPHRSRFTYKNLTNIMFLKLFKNI
ncbi:hypothetical protein BpHYR1_040334 [Brachionus plicatilis]|uniref:HAT C-terminal dimerisation domain-containing protein n=1 Tax=Brachionus plicatilis TaxID=10195 RepID=A0A3M7QF32_BRAPC|nr:hypothetical protein BpHYR1_040334 [Brachionus plicatilis]